MLIIEVDRSQAVEYKTIRLRALAQAPDAFATSYEEEARLSMKEWRCRAALLAKPRHNATFMVNPNGPCGLIEARPDPERPQIAWIDMLFVETLLRRQGWGRQLIEHVARWAIENDF